MAVFPASFGTYYEPFLGSGAVLGTLAGARQLQLPAALAGQYVGLDLAGPEVDLVQLARSLGVNAERITEPDALTKRLRAAFRARQPLLLDVPIERATAAFHRHAMREAPWPTIEFARYPHGA